ncbi:MAG: crotonase/enoyl-CoA hydratase family protein [Proteobacteria bacterium]|nr:crotonase/enoyl-CoA hydratase family protein [Pseudomonadota bacterium]
MTERVTVSIEDHVAVVRLNRPDKHNALDLPMFAALAQTGQSLADDSSVRAVVLEAAGANFCAGIDTSIFEQGDTAIGAAAMAPGTASPANLFQHAAYVWREVPVPVICAISGIAYGAGLQIALGADLRYARPDARLSIMEIKWGIIPDMAITTTLCRIMPADKIKELAWSGRVIDGREGLSLGLVTALHDDPSQAARDTARLIASKSPDAIRAIKRLFDHAWNLADADALKLEAGLQMSLLGGENQVEAVMANIDARAPEFMDPKQ